MIDLELIFCEKKSLAATFTSDVIDLGQANPNTGAYATPLVAVLQFPTAGTGEGASNSVEFAIEDSDDGTDFATAISLGAIAGESLSGAVVIPMPIQHKRHVRLKATVAGTVAGAVTAYLSNGYELPPAYKVEGIDILPTIDAAAEDPVE